MKRLLLPPIVAIAAITSALAGSLQDAISSRWRGAWVIVQVEVYSGCDGFYTNNRVQGDLVSSKGRRRFSPGELAKVDGVDLKRGRVDLLLTLKASVLSPYQDGPFTLYSRRECKAEIMLELPRDVVSAGDPAPIFERMGQVLERHSSVEEARQAESWNQRMREPYPDDYERTLAQHDAWKAAQHNAAVQALLGTALDEAGRIPDRIREDPDYMAGFAAGVEISRDRYWNGCEKAIAGAFGLIEGSALREHRDDTPEDRAWRGGYEDGQLLVYSLEMLRRLPGCFVPVPEVPLLPEPSDVSADPD